MTGRNTGPQPIDLSKLPADDGMTIGQVTRHTNLSRDDVQTMIGVLEKQAGLIPRRTDEQGHQQRVISESLLLPYFQTAAFLMRLEKHNALIAMEKTLHLGANYYLEKLTHIVDYLQTLKDMPRELKNAAAEVRNAAKEPQTVAIRDCQSVQWALDDLAANVRHWRAAAVVLFILCLLLMALLFFVLRF